MMTVNSPDEAKVDRKSVMAASTMACRPMDTDPLRRFQLRPSRASFLANSSNSAASM